ncbi:hypothetical protein AGMMS50284_5560 [Clostridia bacterium]|nr:hypothetical protein AGMMS50284_5560 [Clostridia bacterium]
MVTVVKAVHDPQVELLVDSEYWISYDEIALFVPFAAPLHDRVTFPSATVVLTEQAVGVPQAVVAAPMLSKVHVPLVDCVAEA